MCAPLQPIERVVASWVFEKEGSILRCILRICHGTGLWGDAGSDNKVCPGLMASSPALVAQEIMYFNENMRAKVNHSIIQPMAKKHEIANARKEKYMSQYNTGPPRHCYSPSGSDSPKRKLRYPGVGSTSPFGPAPTEF